MTEMVWPFPGEKPEFGNLKHITAIKNWEQKIEDEAGLHDFEVTMEVSGAVTLEVRAHSEEEARGFAQEENFDLADIVDLETRITDVEDVTVVVASGI